MIEILKKTYLAGADFAHKTWEEVEVRANEVVKKAKLGEKDRAKFLTEMKKRYDSTQGKLEKYVEKVVKDILKKMDIATGADINALKKEVRLLKKANSSAGAAKQSRSSTAKKTTIRAARKPSVATPAKKPTTAKKSPATGAKKRSSTASAKKRTVKSTKSTQK
jgi:polyhydroxyalkanoate synthesis regulator phasin